MSIPVEAILLSLLPAKTPQRTSLPSIQRKARENWRRCVGPPTTVESTDASQFHIGTLAKSSADTAETSEKETGGVFLDRTKWKDVKLTKIEQINHDSYLYRFELPREDQLLGLPVGQHVFVRLKRKDTGEMVQRAYTPVSKQGAVGSIELLIKLVSSLDSRNEADNGVDYT